METDTHWNYKNRLQIRWLAPEEKAHTCHVSSQTVLTLYPTLFACSSDITISSSDISMVLRLLEVGVLPLLLRSVELEA
jgi:hypothetical protein